MPVIQGFGGRVLIGNRIFRANRWTIDWRTDDLDVLTFEGSGFGAHMHGLLGADVEIDCYYHTVDNPFVGAFPLYPGNQHLVEIYYVKGNENLVWNLWNVLCTDMRHEGEVRGIVHYTYRGKYSGGYDEVQGYTSLTVVDPPVSS